MIVTAKELTAIVYAMRNKAIGTSVGYKTKPFGLMLLLHKTLKSKAKTARIGKSEYKFILHECSQYLEVLKTLDTLRMNKPIIDNTIELLISVTTKIISYDNKGSSKTVS